MDLDMPDADPLDQLSQADELQHPDSGEPGTSSEPSEPGNANESSNSDEPDPPEPDPNDLYKDDVKVYDSTTLVILDATESLPVYQHEQNDSIHKRACHTMEITFREISDFGIEKIHLPQNANEADFLEAIDEILEGKTERDLLIFHYHGSAGGVEHNYKWSVPHLPNRMKTI